MEGLFASGSSVLNSERWLEPRETSLVRQASLRRTGACVLSSALILSTSMAFTCMAFAEDQLARSLAANCTSCHGPDGNSLGAIPSIAGLDKAAIVAALQAFKDGTRQATVMHQHAKGYTEQEFAMLADFFSSQKHQ
jgi:cytochrome subunit of sulfide dehydrogenase